MSNIAENYTILAVAVIVHVLNDYVFHKMIKNLGTISVSQEKPGDVMNIEPSGQAVDTFSLALMVGCGMAVTQYWLSTYVQNSTVRAGLLLGAISTIMVMVNYLATFLKAGFGYPGLFGGSFMAVGLTAIIATFAPGFDFGISA